MALELVRRRPIKLPRGFMFWVLFLIWTLGSILVLGVDPAGTLPDSAVGRLLPYTTREAAYFAFTILFLYVGNLTEEELPQKRLVRLLGWFFIWTVAGGVLGMLVPKFSFTSPFELILPESVRSAPYVQQLVHPAAAQVQEFEAGATPRPSAPFDYTNTWGFHLTVLIAWFIVGWIAGRKLLAKALGGAVVAAGIVVLVYSLNRAAWLGFGVVIVFVLVRLVMMKRVLPALVVALVACICAVGVAVSPLSGVIQQRLDEGKSNDVRAYSAIKALELSAESPIIGYGSTRNARGSASSIAVGKSPECTSCGNVPIGINGYGYMLLMSTGWVGAFFFFGFGAAIVWRSRRDRSMIAVTASAVTVVTGFFAVMYDVATWMTVPFITLAILWRQQRKHDEVTIVRRQNDSHSVV